MQFLGNSEQEETHNCKTLKLPSYIFSTTGVISHSEKWIQISYILEKKYL